MRRLAALCCALGLAAPAGAATDPAALAEVQDLIFWTDARPVLIRLHAFVDGAPFRARWEAQLSRLFAYLDRDADGTLDADEARRAPGPQALVVQLQGNVLYQPNAVAPPGALDADKDGRVTRDEFLAYYAGNGAGPFSLSGGFGGGPARPSPTRCTSSSTATATARCPEPSWRRRHRSWPGSTRTTMRC
jgi:hypothetical protein